MLAPKNGKLGAMLPAVIILIGTGLLSLPSVSYAGPVKGAAGTVQAAETRALESTRIGLKNVPLGAGGEHSLAVASDGTVLSWGMSILDNFYIGPGDKVLQPTRMDRLDSVVATAGGDQINLALKSDGTVWSIGYPGLRQVSGLSDIVAVDAGKDHGLALKADGTVWQLDLVLKPIQVSGLTEIVAIAMGAYYSAVYTWGDSLYRATALRKDGTVWTWTEASKVEPMQELSEVVAIAAGFDHHLALKGDGTVWAWGSNTCGQTGGGIATGIAGSPGPDYSAHKVEGIGNVTAISAGGGEHFFSFGHSLALKSDGTVWEWGCDGTANFNPTPSQVAGLARGLAIAAGGEHSLVLEEDGTVWAWGWNYYGQLGNGTRTHTYSQDSVIGPVQVIGLPPLIANYFNEHGQPYNIEEYSYWYNMAEKQWYRGSREGQITPIAVPPWGK